MRLRILDILSALSFTATASASKAQTFFTLISRPGNYIGGGTTETFTPADETFSVTNSTDTVSISFHTPAANNKFPEAPDHRFWRLHLKLDRAILIGA